MSVEHVSDPCEEGLDLPSTPRPFQHQRHRPVRFRERCDQERKPSQKEHVLRERTLSVACLPLLLPTQRLGLLVRQNNRDIHMKRGSVVGCLWGRDWQPRRTEAGQRKSLCRINGDQSGCPAVRSVLHQKISWLHGQMRKAFCRVLVSDVHPGELSSQESVDAMQVPGVSLGPRLGEMGHIHKQKTLLSEQATGTSAQIHHLCEEPEQPGGALSEPLVPGLCRKNLAGEACLPTPSAQRQATRQRVCLYPVRVQTPPLLPGTAAAGTKECIIRRPALYDSNAGLHVRRPGPAFFL